MTTDKNMVASRALNGLIALAGVWEILSPFILNFSSYEATTRSSVIIGMFLLLFAGVGGMIDSRSVGRWSNVVNLVLGIWLVITPFVFGFTYMNLTAMVSSWVTGAVIVIACALSYFELTQGGHVTA